MARNIGDIYDFYGYILRKERGVLITPSEFNANMDAGQLDALNEWFATYGATQTIHDAIRGFREYYQFTSNAAGFVTYPAGLLHLIGTPFTVTGSTVNVVHFVNEDELPFAITSKLRPVSTSYPIAVDTSTGFSLYPQSTQIGFFNYLRRPASPVYGYSQAGRVITYNSATSTQLEFADNYINNIIAKALRYSGVNLDDKGISDFANQYNQETK